MSGRPPRPPSPDEGRGAGNGGPEHNGPEHDGSESGESGNGASGGGDRRPGPYARIGLQRALLVSLMASVLFFGCLVCADGFLSLLTGLDVIPRGDGPLVGPTMAVVSVAIVFCAVLLGFGSRRRVAGRPWIARGILSGVAVYLLAPAVGAVIVALDRVDAAAGTSFFVARAIGPVVRSGRVADHLTAGWPRASIYRVCALSCALIVPAEWAAMEHRHQAHELGLFSSRAAPTAYQSGTQP